jgi:hypothetical protein
MKQYANFEEFELSDEYRSGEPIDIKFADGTGYRRGEEGDQFWYKNDQPHRDGDLPAEIFTDGTQRWFKNGLAHRDGDLPAVIWADGTQFWFKNGMYYTPENALL